MMSEQLTRRHVLLAAVGLPSLAALAACRASLPVLSTTATTADAHMLLMQSATAHGEAAFLHMRDVNVAYAGKWHRLVGKLQPSLVDAGFRGGSEERILLREDLVGQAHTGPRGHKQVVRHTHAEDTGEVRVWFNGEESQQKEQRDAAALVADAYGMFLFGPMLLAKYLHAGRAFVMQLAGIEQVIDGQRRYQCDVLRISMRPGIGLSNADQLALYIDCNTRLMRRVRFTLEGLESTRGTLVEVDAFDPVTLYGVQWPTRFHEKLLRPAPLKVHDWRLTGLDINRGLDPTAVSGSMFSSEALVGATALPSQW